MAVAAGAKLGPYEILAPIGAGGMGEVYKARDTRLDRVVAIKVSKEKFSDRFTREARFIAALNHPQICQLYDVGPDYLVMEFIDGTPLKGPLPLDQAMKYAGQICDALDAAHKKNITHRDLKPGNILVTKVGVKLLDFGLARVAASPDDTMTMAEGVMGTPAYMAPEQWEGKPGDARSDIYAFGCVLYEMLTGKRTAANREAVEPVAIERVIRGCLEKDPEDRWQSARDLRRVLDVPLESLVPNSAAKRNPWRERAGWIAAAIVTLAAIAIGLSWRKSQPAAGELSRWTVYPPEGTAFAAPPISVTVPIQQFAISPDGRSIAFAAAPAGVRPSLWIRSVTETTARPMPGTEGAEEPFWSPDNRWVGFFADGKLKKVQAFGGPVQVIVDNAAFPEGGSWAPDDTILFGAIGSIYRASAAGGTATPVTVLDASRQEVFHWWPHFLPDGRRFLYTVRSGLAEARGVYAGSLDGPLKKLVLRTESEAVFAPLGFILFLSGTTLMAQAFDADRLAATGQPLAVAEHVGRSTAFQAAFSASSSGVLAYAGPMLRPGRLNWYDRAGKLLGSEGVPGEYTDFRLSGDGKRLAVSLVDPQTADPDIWFNDLARGGSQRQTFGPLFNANVMWSPDGREIAFRALPKGVPEVVRKSAAGGGDAQIVLPADMQRAVGMQVPSVNASDWSPDGGSLVVSSTTASSGFDLWLLPLEGGRKPVKYVQAPGDQFHGNFSPDGRLVAYTSSESGRFEVNVRTVVRSDRQWQVSTTGGYEPRWRGDGGEIYYLSADQKLMASDVGPGPTFGAPRELFQTKVSPGVSNYRTHYVASRDGQKFLVNTLTGDPSPLPITVVLNWTAGLKK